jgi:manganese/iron transport system permease protein
MTGPFAVPFMARALAELTLLALICGPVGAFVFVRRLAFVSDALTHTVFPGVVIGFLAGGLDGILLGALVAGLVTATVRTLLTRTGAVHDDAATAVVLTASFSLGVALVSRRSSYTSDLTTFLFGRILTVTPRQIAETAVLVVVILAMLAVAARPLLFRAFDPAGAAAAGYRIGRLDLWLNVIVALVVVAAVRAVGTILVVALLIVPAATARLLSHRVGVIAATGTALIAAAGYLGLSLSWTASIDYGIAVTSASAIVLIMVTVYLLLLPVPRLHFRRVAPPAPAPRRSPRELVG